MVESDFSKIYLNGRWVDSNGTGVIAVVNPTTEDVIANVPAGHATDVSAAVTAARDAFGGWASVPPAERAKFLRRFADAIESRQEDLAELVVAEVGCTTDLARAVQVGHAIDILAHYSEIAGDIAWEEPLGSSLVVRVPAGVVGAITPWNAPLIQVALKLGPALLAGCTVVLKPSELAPLSATVLIDAIDSIALPPGVVNLVSGAGDIGEVLVGHPDVDMISFTGSIPTGRRIAALASESVKRLTLEMGGKSANILLDDADLDLALPAGVGHCYLNNGQVCASLSRMLVPRHRYDEVIDRAKAIAESFSVGDPTRGSQIGPVVSNAQRERVRNYIRKGIEEGARLVAGGPDEPEGLDRGYFVRPTVFADVDTSMTIAQEEIFGPVLSIIPYDDEDDAVQIANSTIYGLSSAVWSSDPARAERVARRLRVGQVMINGAIRPRGAPFGGFKQSGIGREFGAHGLEEYFEIQLLARPETG